MKSISKLAAAAVLFTTSLTGCMTLRHLPVPEEQAATGGALAAPLQVGNIELDVRHAGTVGALAQSPDIPGNDDLTYRFRRGLSRHLGQWASQQEGHAPMLNARIEYDRARSGSSVKQGLPGALTLGLIPIIEDGVFTTTVSVTSGGREVYRHQVQETIRSHMSIFFPTPMLMKHDDKDAIWRAAVDSAMTRLHARLAPWAAAEQATFERDVAGTSARDQRAWLKQNPDSLYRGRILAFLAANSPARDSLTWHRENIAAFDDYQPLIPNEDAIWFIGPAGQQVLDIRNALRQGEDASIVAARILAARHPYRAFDSAETALLRKGGIPAPVLAAMIEVSGQASNTASAAPAAVTTTPPPDVARLVIRGNSGQYLCPWTSSGAVAPWMSKALANSDMGAAAGKALGSYAGAKAMENVPFIGRMLGEKLGEASGRSIAMQAIGGEAYMRETSDLSFRSLRDMARYLQATYASSAQYQQVIEAADEIYPGLNAAIAATATY